MTQTSDDEPPLARPFEVEAHPEYPVDVEIEADEAEREALALALDIPAVGALKARLRVVKSGKRYEVFGALDGRVTQICVVSLDPFETGVHEDIEASFAPAPKVASLNPAVVPLRRRRGAPPPVREVVVDPDLGEAEPIIDGVIDLGALTTEFLALGLDPYPRKPGVAFQPAPSGESDAPSPFAALGRLKKSEPGK